MFIIILTVPERSLVSKKALIQSSSVVDGPVTTSCVQSYTYFHIRHIREVRLCGDCSGEREPWSGVCCCFLIVVMSFRPVINRSHSLAWGFQIHVMTVHTERDQMPTFSINALGLI